ncbi:carbonic anhydrase [Alphaproteobacteria bacterium 46_93_T64]|nr:carbonic anhydrase [Alphaproteobacteria bacterium 46_93_T64]
MKPSPEELFKRNIEWASSKLATDDKFFSKLNDIQTPNYLWIGCSDSRVPANEIVGMDPGELFVHRNVANIVPHSDANCLAVIQYAVEVLEVEHIIITGHYNCGGIRAALDDKDHGQIDNWLANIKDVLKENYKEIMDLKTEQLQVDRLCELNVVEQVRNVARTTIAQRAWRNGKELTVHGWVYDLKDGLLRDLKVDINNAQQIHEAYRINSK